MDNFRNSKDENGYLYLPIPKVIEQKVYAVKKFLMISIKECEQFIEIMNGSQRIGYARYCKINGLCLHMKGYLK